MNDYSGSMHLMNGGRNGDDTVEASHCGHAISYVQCVEGKARFPLSVSTVSRRIRLRRATHYRVGGVVRLYLYVLWL